MKAWQIPAFGMEHLELTERPDPQPGAGQVVVRIHAWSLNYRDILTVEGSYAPKMKLPSIPLSDCAGEIVATGSDVTRVKAGDRVIAAFMQKWIAGEPDEGALRSALGGVNDGVASEYALFDQSGVVPLPDYLSYEEAATLPCTGVTAWHALVTQGHLRPEETVLVQGTGGVSIFALQFGKLMKATVIATSSSDVKIERLREMGADLTINYASEPEWQKVAKDYTSGRGVDHVVEVGGVGTLPKSLRAVRPGGTIHLIGVLSGRGELEFTPVFMRNIRIQGIFVGSREMAEDMLHAMTAHQIHPVIDRVFAFEDMPEALRYMKSGAHFGKIVLKA